MISPPLELSGRATVFLQPFSASWSFQEPQFQAHLSQGPAFLIPNPADLLIVPAPPPHQRRIQSFTIGTHAQPPLLLPKMDLKMTLVPFFFDLNRKTLKSACLVCSLGLIFLMLLVDSWLLQGTVFFQCPHGQVHRDTSAPVLGVILAVLNLVPTDPS